MHRVLRVVVPCLLASAAAALPAPAAAQAPYRANDPGGFLNILPPGNNGTLSVTAAPAFLGAGTPPPHSRDQLQMYGDLVYSSPGLKAADLPKFFKDASFGVKPEDVERTYSPRPGLTIVRDKGFGTPRIYGTTRADAMFGAGYVTGEDRLFFVDVLRNLGRGSVSSFAGGAPGNRALDREQWQTAPYREEELAAQVEALPKLYGAEGAQLRQDVLDYTAGLNAYMAEARRDPSKLPAEYAAIGRPQGPEDWKPADTVATASLVGGIFGKGGGEELESGLLLQALRERFGRRRGDQLFADLRQDEDPEAPVMVEGRRFRYRTVPRRPRRGSVALPDRGSVTFTGSSGSVGEASGGAGARGLAAPLASLRDGSMSNALLVSAEESASGRPLAVFGPQTGYFAPQILMEQELHAPGLDARGVAFPGVNVSVQLGRGRDYAWSATAAGADNIDTFALELCEPGGGRPTKASMHYRFRGACEPIEVLTRTNRWSPTVADSTPAGSETLRAERTKLGIVRARATRRGTPVVYTSLRSTYRHEVDSGIGFSMFNDPGRIRSLKDFQRAADRIGFTFNWLYVDHRQTGVYTSGALPLRAAKTDPRFPVPGDLEWQGFDPATGLSKTLPFAKHAQAADQPVMTSWNNKPARGWTTTDDEWGRQGARDELIAKRLAAKVAGPRKATLTDVVDAMEDAGTADLRAQEVLPWVLKVVGRPSDPDLAEAVRTLQAWRTRGGNRVDRDRDGQFDDAQAVRIMDAWWPRLVRAQFEPTLGRELFEQVVDRVVIHDSTYGDHTGDAFNKGWYTYVEKDLRKLLRRPVAGWSRALCGGGRVTVCRDDLRRTLAQALRAPDTETYRDAFCSSQGKPGDQFCANTIRMRPLGALTHPLIHHINRPTFQQVVEVQGPRP